MEQQHGTWNSTEDSVLWAIGLSEDLVQSTDVHHRPPPRFAASEPSCRHQSPRQVTKSTPVRPIFMHSIPITLTHTPKTSVAVEIPFDQQSALQNLVFFASSCAPLTIRTPPPVPSKPVGPGRRGPDRLECGGGGRSRSKGCDPWRVPVPGCPCHITSTAPVG